MPLWVKAQPPGVSDWGWYSDNGGSYLTDPEGKVILKVTAVFLNESCQVSRPEDLDWQGSYICKNAIPTYGWLSPTGEHHRCAKRAHSLYARFILHTSEEALETQGWIRTTERGSPYAWVRSPLSHGHMTQAQRDWLFDHGLCGGRNGCKSEG